MNADDILNDDEDLQGENNVAAATVTPQNKCKRPYNHHRGPMLAEFVENPRARQVTFNKRKKTLLKKVSTVNFIFIFYFSCYHPSLSLCHCQVRSRHQMLA